MFCVNEAYVRMGPASGTVRKKNKKCARVLVASALSSDDIALPKAEP